MQNDKNFMFLGSHLVHAAERCLMRIKEAEHVQRLIEKAKCNLHGIIWLGDMNFRNVNIDSITLVDSLDAEEADLSAIVKKHDQLTTVALHDDAFRNFHEAKITFKPTYRMRVRAKRVCEM